MSSTCFRIVLLMAAFSSFFVSKKLRAQSQQITGATATSVVQNAFTLTETTSMHFGTMAMLCDTGGANFARITLDPNTGIGTITDQLPAQIIDIDITARTPAVIDVTNAAPNTVLTYNNGFDSNLSCGTCTGGNPDIASFSFNDSGGGTMTTDGAGAVQFTIGATLATQPTCPQQYEDGTYAGTYDITVSY